MDSYISAKLHLVESPETSSLEDFLKAQQRISTSHFEPRAKQEYMIGAIPVAITMETENQ